MVLVVLTAMILITLDQSGNSGLGRVRSLFARVLQPFETAVETVVLPAERVWKGIAEVDDLERENDALRDQLARMKGAELEAESAILAFRELLRLDQLTSQFLYGVVSAKVVGDSPSNFQNTVEINVGSNRGIGVGMAVIDGAGLIGRITKVFPESSIVLLITDPQYSVSAQVLSTPEQIEDDSAPTSSTTPSGVPVNDLTSSTTSSTTTTSTTIAPGATTSSTTSTSTVAPADPSNVTTSTTVQRVIRETGTLEGQGADAPLVLRFVDTSSAVTSVRVGAIVDTAGGTKSLAPQGIPIGRITKVVRQPGTSSSLVEVVPSADLSRLNFVAVVLYLPSGSGR